MKKLAFVAGTFLLPFLLVWVAFVMTAFMFNPYDVFGSGEFWGFSIIYWFVWTVMIGHLVELVEEG